MDNKKQNTYMPISVFFTGACVLVLEIAGTGIIAPFFGSSIYVWASLIAVTMAALAAGYFAGGRLSERKPAADIMYLIILAAALCVFAVTYAAPFVLPAANMLGPKLGAFVSAAMLFTLPLGLLGMVSPYAVKILSEENKKPGFSSGLIYGMGTVGSFVGAISTGFFMIPGLGIKMTLALCACVLAGVSVLWFVLFKNKKAYLLLLLSAIALCFVNVQAEPGGQRTGNIIFEKQGMYSKILVTDYPNGFRGIKSDNVLQTVYDTRTKRFNYGYINLFGEAGALYKGGSALSIGLGGGGAERVLREMGLSVISVELDPLVLYAAEKYFEYDGNCVIGDGRNYIRNTKDRFDLVYVDVFSGFAIGKYLLTEEAFDEIKQALKPGGMLVINVLGKYRVSIDPDGDINEPIAGSVLSTLRGVYKNVYVKTDKSAGETANYIFYATDSDKKPGGEMLTMRITPAAKIQDDKNRVEEMTASVIELWRAETIKLIGTFSAGI